MNLQPLFTTSRVIVAVYRIASTTLLLYYLMHNLKNGQRNARVVRRADRLHQRLNILDNDEE